MAATSPFNPKDYATAFKELCAELDAVLERAEAEQVQFQQRIESHKKGTDCEDAGDKTEKDGNEPDTGEGHWPHLQFRQKLMGLARTAALRPNIGKRLTATDLLRNPALATDLYMQMWADTAVAPVADEAFKLLTDALACGVLEDAYGKDFIACPRPLRAAFRKLRAADTIPSPARYFMDAVVPVTEGMPTQTASDYSWVPPAHPLAAIYGCRAACAALAHRLTEAAGQRPPLPPINERQGMPNNKDSIIAPTAQADDDHGPGNHDARIAPRAPRRKTRGAPVQYDLAQDARIAAAWEMGNYKTLLEVGRAMGITGEDSTERRLTTEVKEANIHLEVRKALDRHRKRIKKAR